MNRIKRYFKKKRLLKKWQEEIIYYERTNTSPYSNSYDLYVWRKEVYKRAVNRLKGERQGDYMFSNILEGVRKDYGPKFMPTIEKEYREYLNKYMCDNIIPTINSVFKNQADYNKKEKESMIRSLTKYSTDVELTLEEYLERVDPFLAGDYMTFKQWKRQNNLDKLLDK